MMQLEWFRDARERIVGSTFGSLPQLDCA